ncbi:MAG: hypothetical protein RRB22_05890 [Gammaproteobacteria bacterium]|nr:hypothetical protein [Gammaproteobacteria bacterium]
MIKENPAELRSCAPIQAQPATFTPENATTSATKAQPSSLKAAALLVLGRNDIRNQSATPSETGRNSGATFTCNEEKTIRAWLTYIEETDPQEIAEVIAQCYADAEARVYYLRRAEEVPPTPAPDYWATCGACRYFQRIEHPNLGHCTQGEPEAHAGLWDADLRYCKQYQMKG